MAELDKRRPWPPPKASVQFSTALLTPFVSSAAFPVPASSLHQPAPVVRAPQVRDCDGDAPGGSCSQARNPPRRELPPKLWVRSHRDLGSFLNPSGRFLYLRPFSGVKKLSKTLRLRHRAAKPKLNGARDTKGSIHRQQRHLCSPPIVKVTQFKSRNSKVTSPGRRRQGWGSAPRHHQPALTARRGREEMAPAQTSSAGGRQLHLRPDGSIGALLANSGLWFHITKRQGFLRHQAGNRQVDA